MAEEKTYTPLLPYDSTLGEHFTSYDSVPYCCDRNLCHPNIAKYSGNVVKYFEYHVDEKKTIISGE